MIDPDLISSSGESKTPMDYPAIVAGLLGRIAVLNAKIYDLKQNNVALQGLLEEANKHKIDKLTGLLSSNEIREKLESFVKEGGPFVLVFGDLDGLKRVNDILGHNEGDDMIAKAGEALRENFRETDVILGRAGGDEMWGIFRLAPREQEDSGSEKVSEAERIQTIVDRFEGCVNGRLYAWKDEKTELGMMIGHVGFSVGYAVFHPGDSPEDVIHRASRTMEEAKAKNKKLDS